MNVLILGRGKLGSALAKRLREAGVEVRLSAAGSGPAPRWRSSERARIVILAVPDAAIAVIAGRLAPSISARDVVLHCAGARTHEELTSCASRGAATGAFHPLVSFASRSKPPPLRGASFVADGAPRAVKAVRWLCRKLGAHCIEARVFGPAYHAAAALLANGSAALAYSATCILRELGLPQREASRALGAMLASVAFNVQELGVPDALTGPVARGDSQTVRLHQAALSALSPTLAAHYACVQPIIESCAAAQRSTPEIAD